MKKQLSILMLLAALLVPWAVKAQGDTITSFPFTCTFEDAADNAHWSITNASPNGWYIGGATNNGGDSALYVSDNNGTANNYSGSACVSYAYLTFEVTNPGQYALQFDWKCAGESTYDFLRVAVAPASTALPTSYSSWTATAVPTGFVAVDGGNKLNLNGTSWTTQTAAINVTSAGVYRLVFAWRNDGSVYNQPPAAIDNVIVAELTCPQPVNLTALPASDQIDFTWNPGGSESQWLVVLRSATDTVTDVVYDSAYTAMNLTPQTMYTFSVYALCGGDDTSLATSTEVRTLCVPLDSLPYFENFDGHTTSTTAATGIQVPCWDAILTGTATYQTGSYVPQIYYSTSNAHSGAYSYRLYGIGYHMLPPMPTSLDSLRLSFWDYTTSTSYALEVGVMEGNTFVPVQVINSPASTHVEYTIYFTNYTGNSRVIAFRNYYPSSSSTYYSYHYLDDVKVDYIPNCPDIVSYSVNATASAARIDWTYDMGLGITPDEFEIHYGYASDSLAGATTVTSTATSLVLTGLDADTSYMVSISPICNVDAGNAFTFSFATRAMPCIEWDTTGSASAGPADTLTVGTPGTSTSNAMPVNNGYNYSYCQHLILASHIATTGPTTFSGIAFDYAYSQPMTHATNCQIYMGNTTRANFTVSAGSSADSMFVPYSQLTLVYQGPLNCTTNGYNYFQFNQGAFHYDGTSNIVVAIVNNSGSTNSSAIFRYETISSSTGGAMTHRVYNNTTPYGPTEMDAARAGQSYWRSNMKLVTGGGGTCLTQASCAAPAVIAMEDTVGNLELSWIPGYMETSWDVDYQADGDSVWTNLLTGTSLTSYTILESSLQPNTHYTFRVTANCTDTNIAGTATYTTPCGSIGTLPFSEDFESYGSGSTVFPSCWYKLGSTADRPYIHGTTTYGHNNTHGLYFYAAAGGYCYAIMPRVNSTLNLTTLQVSFWARQYSTSYNCDFEVGVMTDPTDVATFVALGTVHPAGTDYEAFDVSLANYTGTGKYVAFRAVQHPGTSTAIYLMLDDVTLDVLPACPRVGNVAAENITMNSATITWDTTSAFDYEVQYGPMGFTLGSGTSAVVSGVDSLDITGLTSNTAYDVYVRGLCGADTSVWSSVHTFRTSCGAIDSLPFTEDFESYGTGTTAFPTCWYKLGSTADRPYINATTSYGHNNTHGLYFYAASGGYCYAIMPPVDSTLDITTLQVNFWARQYSTSYNCDFVVGVMTNPTDATTFVAIDTVYPAGTTYEDFDVSLATYTGTGNHIAFSAIQHPGTSTAIYLMLDDVTLDVLPTCPRVEDLMATVVLLDSATIAWTDNSSNASWYVEYDSVPFTPGTGHMTAIHVTDTFCVLTGLDSGTVYHVYVYPECVGAASVADRHISFTTLAASPATVPYSCDFEAPGVNGWDLYTEGQTNYWMVGSDTTNGSTRTLFVTNNGTSNDYTNSSISYSYAVRYFNIIDTGEYAYSFDWKCNGEGNYDFIRALFGPTSETVVAGDLPFGTSAYNFGQTVAPAPWIDLTGRTSTPYGLNMQTTWQNRTGVMYINTPGTYKLVFAWVNDGSGGTTPPGAIDNVTLVRNTCSMPQNVTAALTADSISLTWTPGSGENEWSVSLGTTTVVVNTPAYTFAGLTANTDYTVQIRSICGAGDTSMRYTETYHTPCVAVSVPYSENFDSITSSTTAATGVHVSCWDYIMTGSSTYQAASYQPQVYYSSTYAHSGSYSLRLYGESYTMLPPVDAPLDSLQLTFWDYTTSTSYGLEVGVMEGNTFVPIQTISTPTSTHMEHTVYFATYTGTSRVIAFRNVYTTSTTTYYSYHYIDNVVVDYLPTCPPVLDITATAASTTSITIDWTDQVTASQWQVRYGVNGSTTTTTMTVSNHPVTITGLDTLTSYAFTVRPICSATDTGNWSQTSVLATEICDGATAAFTGTATSTSYYAPVNNFYKYTLSETIIDSAELVGVGEISAIAYSYAYSTASTDKTNVTIWLQPTDKSVFSSNTDLVLLDTTIAVQVYSGNLNCSQGWNYFAFDTTYTWNGYGNLLVIVDDNSNDYNGSAYTFNSSACTGYKTLVWYSDTYDADPTSSTYSGTKAYYQYRPTMKLVSCGAAPCEVPVVMNVDTAETSIFIEWIGTSSGYEVAIVEDAWVAPATGTLVADTFYTFTDLTGSTNYYIAVRGVCGSSTSDWTYMPVTTLRHPCAMPTGVTVSNPTYSGATVSWNAGEEETSWEVNVFCSSPVYDHTYTVNDNPTVEVTGLDNGITYKVIVRALCDADWFSPWTDTVDLTTTTCPIVTGVSASGITATSATISWNSTGAASYEVEYGDMGFHTGDGHTVTSTTTSVVINQYLEEQSTYDVFVRSVCADGVYSGWSEKYTFRTTAVGIEEVVNGNVVLYPNPASTMVTIRGIEGESTVTVVDLNGREVYKNTANSDLTIDLTGYAKGAYFVRITGENTTAIRKLIVK